ncbi:MAG: tricorn protease [Pseudonocardiales bacterium]|nr:tricorn protease [Pseudonocardiales bacterium]
MVFGRRSLGVATGAGVNLHVIARNASPYFRWSPDDRWIAYVGRGHNVWLVRPDGADRHLAVRRIAVAANSLPGIAWSPDGTRLLFVTRSQHLYSLVAQDIDTINRQTILTGAGLSSPEWAPDGRSIAYVRGRTLVVRHLSTGAETAVARDAWAEQWSPDGRWIAYLSGGTGTVEVVASDGTGRHQVAELYKPEALSWGSPSR